MANSKRRAVTGDLAIVATLLTVAWLGIVANRSLAPDAVQTSQNTDLVLLTALVLPLLFRRRFPLSVLTSSTVAFLWVRVAGVLEGTVTSVAIFLAVFSAGAYSRHRFRDLARGLSVAASFGVLIWSLVEHSAGTPGHALLVQVFSLAMNVAFYAAAWLMGDLWRSRADDQAELARRAAALAEQQDQLAAQAVANERLRIAQELHDIVGHHVSVMGVQAGAARRSLSSDPEGAARLLSNVEEAGRRAVSEMGRLVGLLRSDGTGEVAPPLPTLRDLEPLVDSTREAGIPVELHRVGRPRQLDPTNELSAYRVVQEALTNAVKHGVGAPVVVEVSYLVDHLSLRVRNQAEPSAVPRNGGRGLPGMAERVVLVGGTLRTGLGGDGVFEVLATIPYGSAP